MSDKKTSNQELELSSLRQEIEVLKHSNIYQKLHDTEVLLNSCLESPLNMIILAIDKNYKYLYFNKAHIAVMKYAYKTNIEIGMDLIECVTEEEDKVKAKINYDKALSGISHSTIEVYGEVNKSYYESFYNPIYNEKNEIIGTTAFARDVTERVNAENELKIAKENLAASEANLKIQNDNLDIEVKKRTKELLEKQNKIEAQNQDYKQINEELFIAKEKAEESEKKFRKTIEFSPIPTAVAKNDGELILLNKQFTNTYGYTLEEMPTIGKWFELVYPDEEYRNFVINDWGKEVENSIRNSVPTGIKEYQVTCKNGEIKTVAISAYFEKDISIGLFQDITEQKKKIIESLRLKTAIEQVPVGIALADENLNLYFCNAAGIGLRGSNARLVGISKEEFKNWQVLTLEGKPYEVADLPLVRAFNEKIEIKEEFIVKHQDGSEHICDASAVPVYDANHQIIRSVVIFPDITERKQVEEELIKAKEKAEESDRLKTAFLQNMSHEIRTPLNAISGFSGMLNKPELSEEKRKSFVSIIQNSSKQLISIVSDILTISSLETKQEKTNIDKVGINNIIVELLAIFKLQALNQNISLYAKQQLSNKQSEIYTDKTKITQILTNLLTNALKFTHEGFIEFGYNLKENELEFYVKDSGIGIKSEYHEKIFERFRQADKSINKLYGGTGLGLAISKAFAELLGGKIWVQSELEKGSTFYFTIPYKPVNEIDKTTTPNKQIENFRTILVAEDEEYNFLFIEELLIDLDLKLIHGKDGKETIEISKTNPNIDLILMDIKMPIMTGHEAAKIIKELKPDLPIVAQSAYALEHERAKYEGIFDDYLTKPIEEDDLKQMVLKYIKIEKE